MLLNLGIAPRKYPQQYLDSESGACLVVGGAACVWSDVRPFAADYGGKFGGKYDVIAINDIGMHFPGPVKHLYSNNTRFLKLWQAARRDQFCSTYGFIQHLHSNHAGQIFWPWPGAGTSALGATYTALALGYDEFILCGVPLDNTPHYFEPQWRKSSFTRQVPLKGSGQIKYWAAAAKNVFQGKVTAQSGRLTEILPR